VARAIRLLAAVALAASALGGADGCQAQPPAEPAPAAPTTAETSQVAITFDDLPLASGLKRPVGVRDLAEARAINASILGALRRRGVPATGFVNEQHVRALGAGAAAVLRAWTRGSFDLGNHFYSHADVNDLTVQQAQDEIVRGEPTIRALLREVSRAPRFLRFPFNHLGDKREKQEAIEQFIAHRGYRLAPCTIDGSDYLFNGAFALAKSRRDFAAMRRLEDAYISFSGAAIDWYTALDRQVLGYAPPHVMLLHASPLNAAAIGAILKLFEQRGYRFVTLSEALADPAYSIPDTYVTQYGPMWGYRWARELHVRVNGAAEPEPPSWVAAYVNSAAARQVPGGG
jgi:peptidoglycan/xylan/chitin deacetylase (PgdA/CDA1 family)